MKTLILVRHAKAEDLTDSFKDDLKRKLTSDGISDAETMGIRLFSMQIKPDTIVSSNAERAKYTAQIVAEKLRYSKNSIVYEKKIYGNAAAALMKIIGITKTQIQTLMLVGHNPGLSELLFNLCKTNIENIPKGGVAGIKLHISDWKNISAQCGTLLFFDSPKNN